MCAALLSVFLGVALRRHSLQPLQQVELVVPVAGLHGEALEGGERQDELHDVGGIRQVLRQEDLKLNELGPFFKAQLLEACHIFAFLRAL